MAKKSKAAKADETATRVEEFTKGQRDRMIRLIEDLQREREGLQKQLENEKQVSRRLADAIGADLITNPYFVSLQRRHQTVMGMLGQVRISLAESYSVQIADAAKWINEIIDVDQLAQ